MIKDTLSLRNKAEEDSLPAKGKGDIFGELQSEMNSLFEKFFQNAGLFEQDKRQISRSSLSKFLSPSFDLAETDDAIEISAELPGAEEKDIELSLDGNVLTVKGEKKSERDEKKSRYHISERSYGSFQRSFALPAGIDSEKIRAEFAKGVLRIRIPKDQKLKAKEKKIRISGGDAS